MVIPVKVYLIHKSGDEVSVFPIVSPRKIDKLFCRAVGVNERDCKRGYLEFIKDGEYVIIEDGDGVKFGKLEEYRSLPEVERALENYIEL